MAAARLADDVRQMRELLGIGEGGAMLLPAAGLPGAQGEAAAAAAGAEPWGDKGRGAVFTRDVNDVDKVGEGERKMVGTAEAFQRSEMTPAAMSGLCVWGLSLPKRYMPAGVLFNSRRSGKEEV